MSKIILIVGSAPDVTEIVHWDMSIFHSRVAINNSWQVLTSWDYLIYPEDFPHNRLPTTYFGTEKKFITATEYVPHQNQFGGVIYAGATMAFTAGYWALGALQPDIIAFVGCDMVYPVIHGTKSHFYGNGAADPLRKDITLQSLEAKSNRLMAIANKRNCAVLNLSVQEKSRLTFPKVEIAELSQSNKYRFLENQKRLMIPEKVQIALKAEQQLDYFDESGRYWENLKKFDSDNLLKIDKLWIESVGSFSSSHIL